MQVYTGKSHKLIPTIHIAKLVETEKNNCKGETVKKPEIIED
jgi:hypothetical protein